jgi:hypothetical protein
MYLSNLILILFGVLSSYFYLLSLFLYPLPEERVDLLLPGFQGLELQAGVLAYVRVPPVS